MVSYKCAEKADGQSAKDIARRVIQTNYVSFLGEGATADFINSGMSDKEINDGLDNCTVMLCNEQMIGFAITNGALLHLIMIDVPFQNEGYGSVLLAYIEKELFAKYDRLTLQTFEENTVAAQFYLKNGWVICKRERVEELDKIMLHFEKTNSSV